ncbi:unnamed protein product [Gemmataceae bacterium]|nr:unnamed protein product [Gemmataceae bacterium]VTU02446.1 unnamed protein product [Gemmataceae bacterium]
MPTVSETIGRTVEAASKLLDRRHNAYWQLARKVGRGEEVDPDEVIKLVEAAGRDIHEFQRDAETVARRFELAANLAAAEEKRLRLAAVEKELLTLGAAFDEFQARHAAAVRPLVAERNALGNEVATADAGRSELMRECPYPDLVEHLGVLRDERNGLTERLKRLGAEARDHRSWLDGRTKGSNAQTTEAHRDLARHRLPDIEAEEARLTAEVRALDAEIEVVEAQTAQP